MGNMRFKVGDRVRIKSIDWYNENKDEYGEVICKESVFVKSMSRYCDSILTIENKTEDCYWVKENVFNWTDEMIEGLMEEETKFGTTSNPVEPKSNANCLTRERAEGLAIKIDKELPSGNQNVWELPEGYQFTDENGNVINATKIILEKKNIIREEQIDNAAQEYIDSDNAVLTYSDGFCEQTDHPFVRAAFKAGVEWADNNVTQDDCSKAPKLTSQDYSNGRFGYRLPAGFEAKLTERELILTPEKPEYPKTYAECCAALGIPIHGGIALVGNWCMEDGYIAQHLETLRALSKLLIYRDAYWKIAGEEMGLGKPWEPDWNDTSIKYCLERDFDAIDKNVSNHKGRTFAFPTKEMRDAFKENFDPDIEICKEFL